MNNWHIPALGPYNEVLNAMWAVMDSMCYDHEDAVQLELHALIQACQSPLVPSLLAEEAAT